MLLELLIHLVLRERERERERKKERDTFLASLKDVIKVLAVSVVGALM